MANVDVKLRPQGGQEVKRALTGMAADVERARQKLRSDAQRTAQAEVRATRDSARARVQTERQAVDQSTRALQDFFRVMQRIEKAKEREVERSALARVRAERRAQEQIRRDAEETAKRNARTGRSAMGTVIGGAMIGVGIASNQVSRAQAALGVEDTPAVFQRVQESRTEWIRQTTNAGWTVEQAQHGEAAARQIARENNLPFTGVLNALSASQEKFSNLPAALSAIVDLGRIAAASGADLSDMAQVAGEFGRQFGLNETQTAQSSYQLIEAGKLGSLGPRDFAQTFSSTMGAYVAARGQAGASQAGAADFLATAQVMAAGGGTREIQRTRFANLISAFTNPRYQDSLRRAGVRVTDSNGIMLPIEQIAQSLAANQKLRNPRTLSRVMPDIQAREAMITLRRMEDIKNAGGVDQTVGALARSSADSGKATVDEYYRRWMNDSTGRDQQTRTEREASVADQVNELSEAYHNLSDWATDLGNRFPILSSATQDVIGAMQSMATTMLGMSAASGAMGTFGAGLSALGKESVSSAGKLKTFGAFLAAFSAGYAVGSWLNEQEVGGDKIGRWAERGIGWIATQFDTETSRAYNHAPGVRNGLHWQEGVGWVRPRVSIEGEIRLATESVNAIAGAVAATPPGDGPGGRRGPLQ